MSNFSKRILAVLVSVCLLVPCVQVMADVTETAPATQKLERVERKLDLKTVPEVIGAELATERKHLERRYDKEESLYNVVFENADGTETLYLFDYPVKYKTAAGEIKDIKLDIKQDAKKPGTFVAADHKVQTTFSKELSDGIKLKDEDVSVTLQPKLPKLPTANVKSDAKIGTSVSAEDFTAKLIDEKTVSYRYDDKTSLEYLLTYTGFKEDIVVSEYTGQTEYEFTLLTEGLKLENIEGSYYLTDENGEIKATLGDIIIFTADERNNAFGSMTHETIHENEEYQLTIHVDADYLRDEATVYPIRIDPTIEINYDNNGDGGIEDVTINSNAGSSGTSGSLSIGLRENYGISRVLMRFPDLLLNNLPGKHQIIDAYVELRDLMCQAEEMRVACYAFTGNYWSESTATWSTVSPNSYQLMLDYNDVSYSKGLEQEASHRYQFNITNAVKHWKSLDTPYYSTKGIIFKALDTVENGSTYTAKTFASYNRSSNKPSLSISYRELATPITITEASNRAIYLAANGARIYLFTPTVDGTYSIWTTGSTDTHISVYSGTTGMSYDIASDNDDGHGTNSCLTLSMVSGTTYQIVVQGQTTSTSGYSNLIVRRGLPASGSEKPDYFTEFNSSTYKTYNNCYTYALSTLVNPITGNKYDFWGANPGELSGIPFDGSILNNAITAKNEIEELVISDCIAWGGARGDFYEVQADTMVPEGYYKVALAIDTGENTGLPDYHWYRQVENSNGKWAHKRGITDVIWYDNSNEYIYNPSNADWGNYEEFLGYYALKVPEISTALLSENVQALICPIDIEKKYEVRNSLNSNEFLKFIPMVTSKEELKNIVGEAHDYCGSGYIGEVYYTLDGYKVAIYYYKELLYQIRILKDDKLIQLIE